MIQGLRVSALVQLGEVRSYFSGKPFEGKWDGDSFTGSVSTVDLKIEATGRTYEVKVESVDDPEDADEVSTSEPLKAIAEFLGRDIPGGEHFERMSSVPAFFAHSIAMAAELVGAGAVGREAAIRMLRRMSSWRPTADSAPSRPGTDLSELEKDAKKKGWKALLKKDSTGDDVLEIDVSGIYRATVVLGSIVYSYDYVVRGEEQVRESGTTDDPIREYEKWAQQDEVREAFRRSRSKRSEKKHEEMGKTRPAPEGQA